MKAALVGPFKHPRTRPFIKEVTLVSTMKRVAVPDMYVPPVTLLRKEHDYFILWGFWKLRELAERFSGYELVGYFDLVDYYWRGPARQRFVTPGFNTRVTLRRSVRQEKKWLGKSFPSSNHTLLIGADIEEKRKAIASELEDLMVALYAFQTADAARRPNEPRPEPRGKFKEYIQMVADGKPGMYVALRYLEDRGIARVE